MHTARALGRLGFAEPVALAIIHHWSSTEKWRWGQSMWDYRPQAGDVFVCTYAKSGTNWMMQIVHQIAHRGAGEFAHIHDVVPWPDAMEQRVVPAQMHDPIDSPTGLRAVKTHLDQQYVRFGSQPRYLHVVRDPKDCFVSSYHFGLGLLRGFMDVDLSPEVWLEEFMSPRFMFSSWPAHTAGWWAERHQPNVALVTFDGLKRDLEGEVRRIAAFLGVDLTAEELAAVVDRASFASMKRDAHKFVPAMPSLPDRRPAEMIRAGKKGRSRELITPAQQAAIDDWCRSELRRLGSDFPYDEMFGLRG